MVILSVDEDGDRRRRRASIHPAGPAPMMAMLIVEYDIGFDIIQDGTIFVERCVRLPIAFLGETFGVYV